MSTLLWDGDEDIRAERTTAARGPENFRGLAMTFGAIESAQRGQHVRIPGE